MIVPARRRGPRLNNYRRSGLGVLNYYDLLAQANLQDCSPMDSTCVTNNVAKQAAVEDLWTQYRVTGAPDDTKLTFTPLTQAQVLENYNPADVAHGGNVIDTRGILSVSTPAETAAAAVVAPTPTPAVTAPAPAPVTKAVTTTPQGATVVTSSGAQNAPGSSSAAPASSGFGFSSIPTWGWLVAAGVAVFALKGR